MTYGFDLDDELHQRLRGAVPKRVLDWVERETGRRVVDQQPLEGGQSAAIHRLRLDGQDDVVVQRFVLDWIDEEPWAPANEAMVLGLLADTPVPSPRVLAADPDGAITGAPTVAMTALPGSITWEPTDFDTWLDGLVNVMIMIHSVPAPDSLRDWEPYAPEGVPPVGTRYRWAWERAVEAYVGDRPTSERVFLHRDFHPGNVLWEHGKVSGVVDWVSSCAGPPEEDVSHCRGNLARHHSQRVADQFLERWLRATGRTEYHPYWDLVNAVSMGGGPPHPRQDEFVASAAGRL